MPSYGEIFSFGWKKTKENFLFLLGLLVIFALLSVLNGALQEAFRPQFGVFVFIIAVLFWFLNVLLELGYLKIMLKFVAGNKPTYKDLYEHYPLFLNFLLAAIVTGLIVLGGFILLILPGIYLAVRLQFVPILVADKGLSPIDAVKAGWNLTKGKWLNVFAFDLLLIGLNILGVLALLVGLLVTIPMSSISFAYFYKKLQG